MTDRGYQSKPFERWENDGGATRKISTSVLASDRSGGSEVDLQAERKQVEKLPPEIADWFTKPLARFVKIEIAAAVMLIIATVAALVLSNSGWAAQFMAFWETPIGLNFGDFEFSRSIRHWINDGLLTLFFFVVALELKRELVLGELRDMRTAALSIAGALGGIIVPAAVYLLLMIDQPGINGWGTVTATSAAFVVGSLAILGSRIPPALRFFLLSVAIFDDIGAILIVAIGYGEPVHSIALAAAILGVLLLAVTARLGIRSIPVYFVLGLSIWLCFDASGIHPTLTGVAMGLMTPAHRWVSKKRMRAILRRVLSYPREEQEVGDSIEQRDLRQASTAAQESSSPVDRLEFVLHPWVGFAILPIFALANAGVAFSSADLTKPISIAILIAFVVGKPVGVISACWLAVRLKIAKRPPGLTWPLMIGGSLLTGIGFIMALFIAGLAFTPQQFNDARIAILLSSVISGLAGIVVLFWLTSSSRKSQINEG